MSKYDLYYNNLINGNNRSGCCCSGNECLSRSCQRYCPQPVGPTVPIVAIGPTGPMGPQGLQGIAGAPGERGPKGETGAMGVTGPAGPAGLAATIAVEPAIRVAFDDNPSVMNVGTPQNAVLKFAIPSGTPGATGPTGTAGPKGDTGLTGEAGPKGDTGPTGPAAPVVVRAFGQINSGTDTIDITANKQKQVPLSVPGAYSKVTVAPSTITIPDSGYYTLYYAADPYFETTAMYADLTFSVRSNGANLPETVSTVSAPTGTSGIHFYGSTIVQLPAKAVLDVAVNSSADGRLFFLTNNTGSLILYKLD